MQSLIDPLPIRLWHGNAPLWQAICIAGIGGYVCLALSLVALFYVWIMGTVGKPLIELGLTVWTVLLVAHGIYAGISILRCASNSWDGILAKIAAVLILIFPIYVLVLFKTLAGLSLSGSGYR